MTTAIKITKTKKTQQIKNRTEKIAKNKNRSWFSIKNAHGQEAEILIFEEIGFFGIEAKEFTEQLSEITAPVINLRINSPGGEVMDGIAIFNALKRHDSTVIVHVEAIAASVAAVIAMAGDQVLMARNSWLMIHKAFGLFIGNADELRQQSEVLDKIDNGIARVFADKAGLEMGEVLALMQSETWFEPEEAMEIGLVDGVTEEDAELENRFDLTIFNNAPTQADNKEVFAEAGKKKDIEKALRDAGHSRKEAKAFLAGRKGKSEKLQSNTAGMVDRISKAIDKHFY